MICNWSEYVTWDKRRSFPGSYYIRLRPRLDPADSAYRGPGGTSTSIIDHTQWSYEPTHTAHTLTLSPHPPLSSEPPSHPGQHPRVPPPLLSPSPPRLSTPSAPFHPLITSKCQPWPLSLTPKRPPNHELIWDIYSHVQEEVIINHLSNIYTNIDSHRVFQT